MILAREQTVEGKTNRDHRGGIKREKKINNYIVTHASVTWNPYFFVELRWHENTDGSWTSPCFTPPPMTRMNKQPEAAHIIQLVGNDGEESRVAGDGGGEGGVSAAYFEMNGSLLHARSEMAGMGVWGGWLILKMNRYWNAAKGSVLYLNFIYYYYSYDYLLSVRTCIYIRVLLVKKRKNGKKNNKKKTRTCQRVDGRNICEYYYKTEKKWKKMLKVFLDISHALCWPHPSSFSLCSWITPPQKKPPPPAPLPAAPPLSPH